jgi:hypothetical protein
MTAWASGLPIGVVRVSRLLRGVVVIAMPDAGLDTKLRVKSVCKVPTGAGVRPLRVPGVAAGEFIEHHSVAEWVEAKH